MAAGTRNEEEQDILMEEVDLLLAMNEHCMKLVFEYYQQEETRSCNVDPQVHTTRHDYGPHRMRTIDDLTDYEALHYTNFSKMQLKHIYSLLNFQNQPIKIRCSQTQTNHCAFSGEEIYIFSIKCVLAWITFLYVIYFLEGHLEDG